MSREIVTDFSRVIEFIKQYSLDPNTNNAKFTSIISQQHKKFFAYLCYVGELTILRQDDNSAQGVSDNQLAFLTESCSDIGSALFVMIHGAYKATKMMLRSSIETFIKGFNLDALPELSKEKSVFVIFDNARSLDFYLTEPQKGLIDKIHQHYKLLCQDAHTASAANMKHITALNYFPIFESKEATVISKICTELVSCYLTLLSIKYNSYFHKMHHRNRDNIIESIPKEYRPLINGIN